MTLQKSTLNGVKIVADSSALTVPITDVSEDGGDIVASSAATLALRRSAIVVDSVADLVTVELVDGHSYMTLGYYAVEDGGGNLYRYNASSSDTVDGGFVLTASVGRFIAVEQGVADLRKFGAKGDVGTDSDSFNNALSTGVKVLINDGLNVHINETIDIPQRSCIEFCGFKSLITSFITDGSPTLNFAGEWITILGNGRINGDSFNQNTTGVKLNVRWYIESLLFWDLQLCVDGTDSWIGEGSMFFRDSVNGLYCSQAFNDVDCVLKMENITGKPLEITDSYGLHLTLLQEGNTDTIGSYFDGCSSVHIEKSYFEHNGPSDLQYPLMSFGVTKKCFNINLKGVISSPRDEGQVPLILFDDVQNGCCEMSWGRGASRLGIKDTSKTKDFKINIVHENDRFGIYPSNSRSENTVNHFPSSLMEPIDLNDFSDLRAFTSIEKNIVLHSKTESLRVNSYPGEPFANTGVQIRIDDYPCLSELRGKKAVICSWTWASLSDTYKSNLRSAVDVYVTIKDGLNGSGTTLFNSERSEPNYLPGQWTMTSSVVDLTDLTSETIIINFYSNRNAILSEKIDFTVTAATNIVNSVAHGYADDTQINIKSETSLPSGLFQDTIYFVVNKTDDTFQLSLTQGGSVVGISDTGTGTHSACSDYALFGKICIFPAEGFQYFDNKVANGDYSNHSSSYKDPVLTWTNTNQTELPSGGRNIELDSSSAALTLSLPDGKFLGDRTTVSMTDASNSSTISVNNHETSSPEVFTFDAVGEYLILEWVGSEWVTIKATATV